MSRIIKASGGGSFSGAHADLTGVTANQHHNQSHAIGGGDHSGTLAHSALSSITATDHHTNANDPTANEKAALAGTSGTAPSGANKLVDNADTRNSDSRTPLAHALVGALHSLAGGTAGFVIRASGAATYAWAQLAHSDLNIDSSHSHLSTTGKTANDHHNQLHHAEHEPGGGDTMAADAAAGTASLRSLGTTSVKAAAGDHTTPAMTATVAGHVPTPPNDVTKVLHGDATWAVVAYGSLSGTPSTFAPSAHAASHTTGADKIATGVPTGSLFLRDDFAWAAPTAAAPDISSVVLRPAGSETLATNLSAVAVRSYLIASGQKLTIGSAARFRIL